MSVNRKTVICREGWYYLFVLAFVMGGAVLREINLLMLLSGMMIGPLLINWRMAVAAMRRISVRRRLPETVAAGDVVAVEVEVTNGRRRAGCWAVAVHDVVIRRSSPGSGKQTTASLLLSHVAAGGTARAVYRGRLMERGRYTFGPLRASTRFPLGFIRRRLEFDQAAELIVLPRLGRLTPRFRQLQRHAQTWGSRRQSRRGWAEGDFYGLRDWRAGDSRRWIHWRSSARRGSLTVRQFEQQHNQDLALVVDLWQPEGANAGHLERVERIVRFASTILSDRCQHGGGELTLAITGRRPATLRGAVTPAMLREAMRALAVAEADSEDQLPGRLEEMLDEVHPGTRILVLSTRPVQLDQGGRLARSAGDPSRRAALERVVAIDAAGDEISELFDDR